MGLLARWYQMQPSEIERLDLEDFSLWVEMAKIQIKQENKGADT